MPQRRTQEQRSSETRGKLIEAAIGLICDGGYLSTTTTEIADRAGVSRGALQHHFGAKSDLMLSVLEEICDGFRCRIEKASRSRDTLAAGDDQLAACCTELVQTLWEVYGGDTYQAAVEIILSARSDPDLNVRVHEYRALSVEIAEDLWTEMFADLDLPPQRLTDLLHFTVAALRGFSLHNRPEHDPERDPEHDEDFRRRQLAMLRDFLACNLRPGIPPGQAKSALSDTNPGRKDQRPTRD